MHLGKDLPVKRTRLAALALALGLASAACGDDDPKPKISPPESSSPAPTETDTTSEPPSTKRLGPEETVRAWVKARNITVRTGDVKKVYALSAEECESCTNSVEPVRQVYEDGGRLVTSGWRVSSVKRRPNFGSSRSVAAAIVFAAGRTFPTADAEPIVYDQERRIMVFRLARIEGDWKIEHFAYAS